MNQLDPDPELVAGLFEAALDPNRSIREIMSEFARRVGVDAAYFKLVENTGDIVLEGVGGGIREGSDHDYLENYLETDVRVPRVALAPTGTVFDDRSLISRAELRRSAFHNEWLPRYEIGHLLHANISTSAEHTAIVTLAQDRGRGEFVSAQQQQFALYVPFFVRAAHLRIRLAQTEARSLLLAGALDYMRGAALLVDRNGTVHFANAEADALLAAGDGVFLSRDELALIDWSAHRALRRRLDATRLPETSAALTGRVVVTAQRPSGKTPYRIEVLPVPRSSNAALGSFGLVSLVLISDPAKVAGQRLSLVRATYGLTQAEAAIASAVASGATLQQCAERRGVSIGTVRSQMKQVLGKTGCRRQADLVRLVGADDYR